jgi:hypothetical protein
MNRRQADAADPPDRLVYRVPKGKPKDEILME